MAVNPDFLRKGHAISDFMNPDRVVIGSHHPQAIDVLTALYQPLIEKNVPLLTMSPEAAELTKYATNTFLALKIAFINELSGFCENTHIAISDVLRGLGSDNRIGPKFLKVGPGYGGPYLTKDTLALLEASYDANNPLDLVKSVIKSNSAHKDRMVEKISQAFHHRLKGKTFGILGATFKAHTSDMSNSPSLDIIPQLQKKGALCNIYDPQAHNIDQGIFPGAAWCKDVEHASQGADALIILTEWPEFQELNFSLLRNTMKTPLVIDLRNLYTPNVVIDQGFDYLCLGWEGSFSLKQKKLRRYSKAA